MKIKKIILGFILFFYLLTNYSIIFAQTITPPPTPTPTYTLFQDTNQGGGSVFDYLTGEKAVSTFGNPCGKIGEKCCGKLTSPRIGAIFNAAIGISSGFGFLGPIITIGAGVLLNFITPATDFIFSSFEKIYKNIFPTEQRGYCVEGNPSNIHNINECTCVSSVNLQAARLCSSLTKNDEMNQCFNNCMKDGGGVWTALGCFSSDFSTLLKEKIFGLGIGLAGIVAFFCIIYAAFQIQSSSGNAEKIKKAQELLTSCIMGLILIIFSVFILKLIGVNILQIPGFK